MVGTFFDANDLADLREVALSGMPDTCSITRIFPGTVNEDGSSEPGSTTTVVYACRVSPSGGSPQETLIASRVTDVTPFTFSLPWNASVSEKDTIVFQNGTYQVIGILAPTTYMTSVRAVTRRIT